MTDIEAIIDIAGAAVGGLAVGVEREWSGHASGPGRRFAGVRTFALLGGLAGIAGWLWTQGDTGVAALLIAAAAALIVSAYVITARRDVESTTEVAGLVVLAAGFLAGSDRLALASGVIATTVLILVEKSRMHAMVARLNDEEISAGARFAVMAIVILPLLPADAYGPYGAIRPRALWAVVLFFTGISFAGYIARRAVGARHGDALAGLLGGLVSSTQVTLAHSQASGEEPRRAMPLACGAIAASTVLFVRTLFAASVLSQPLAIALIPYAASGLAVGLLGSAATLRRARPAAKSLSEPTNPLQFRSALKMAVLFQVVLTIVSVLRAQVGDRGLILTGAVVGFTDVDAATFSMARSVGDGVAPAAAAKAVAAGMLANTVFKLGIALFVGRGAFRIATGASLAAMSVALVLGLIFIP